MVSWVVGGVVVVEVLLHVCINVFSVDLHNQTVRIGVQKTHVFTVPRFQCIIVEITHEMLGQIKYGHSHIIWLVEQNFFLYGFECLPDLD